MMFGFLAGVADRVRHDWLCFPALPLPFTRFMIETGLGPIGNGGLCRSRRNGTDTNRLQTPPLSQITAIVLPPQAIGLLVTYSFVVTTLPHPNRHVSIASGRRGFKRDCCLNINRWRAIHEHGGGGLADLATINCTGLIDPTT